MTVNTHLTDLASGLVLSPTEKSSIATSISTLSARLEAYFGSAITSHFQFGSSTRETILPRRADSRSDIDYMVVFSTATEGQKKPQTYLDRLRRFAETKYASSEISQSSPTIVLSLNHIRFELVPAVYNYAYYIPAPASPGTDWMSTDPNATNQVLVDKNKAEHSQIKPLVRLVKYWNATQGYPFASFAIERYIVQQSFYSCAALKDYFYAFWSNVGYNASDSQNVKDRVERAKKYAAQAKAYEQAGYPSTAESEIRKIVPSL